ncbi:PA3496 family putative envelope integrity protein [Legionella sp. D16C41]|uniref:PA3496 family putative envelope integrity protein n=1 Tax=Legionella sp. D16C41 TaxID=3402688 RepID=UPI003AF432EF
MNLPREYDQDFDEDAHSFSEYPIEEEEDLAHKKHVRKLLEEKLERKRLRENIDELDGEFNWDDLE